MVAKKFLRDHRTQPEGIKIYCFIIIGLCSLSYKTIHDLNILGFESNNFKMKFPSQKAFLWPPSKKKKKETD